MSDQSNPAEGGSKAIWLRGLWMLVLAVLIGAAATVLHVVTLLQFILMLTDHGKPNPRVAAFGTSLGAWLAKAARFQTGSSEDKPWPWSPLE